jgi:hypothetical protein
MLKPMNLGKLEASSVLGGSPTLDDAARVRIEKADL